ncbi:MAG TPA: hypothetical protein ENN65_06895 [Candidatus Hydrogenedentes bacterium]|nr:hypothetical protein [Candidatus Hydrogenedentota bacterium]
MNTAKFPGDELRSRREERGWTLLDVQRHIHVPLQHLQAIEAGNIEALPVETYAVGFIKSYCQLLELSPERYIDQYRALRRARATGPFRARRVFSSGQHPRWLEELIAWGAICALLLLGWFTYAVVVRPLAQSAQPRVEAGTPESAPTILFEDDF